MTRLASEFALRPRVGIFGSAFHIETPEADALARRLGKAIAARGLIAVTGATSGLPHVGGQAAIEMGGTVLGISPARDYHEHIGKFAKPIDGCTHIFYTGQGYTGRNYLSLRNCDLAVFLGGEAGTLEEFCIGVYEGLVLGALTNSGGICGLLPTIVQKFRTNHGEVFLCGTDPERLLEEMLAVHATRERR
ncbi:MAG TPA: hypothetical protein VOA87_06020 [Thermoanaerobaculia bacterium]|nr:hypothetical protein [Thermoanaerobaculia bacterium]